MITKTGSNILYPLAIGAGLGVGRNAFLNEEEDDLLRKYHRLSEDSDLQLRNAGRGMLGSLAGSGVGATIGVSSAIPGIIRNAGDPNMLLSATRRGKAGLIGGAVLGGFLSTNKYARPGYDRVNAAKKDMLQQV